MNELFAIPYSPWSIRVVLALDYAGIPYVRRSYLPTLSEPGLRWRLGRLRGPVSVPILFPAQGPPLEGGLAIAGWASDRSDQPLVPTHAEDAVTTWVEQADRLSATGRVRTTKRVLDTPEALRESLPPMVRRLGPLGLLIGRDAARRLLRKYPAPREVETMNAVLATAREQLTDQAMLLGTFSFADIALAAALDFVSPHNGARLGPSSRRCWTESELADRYPDLLAWRDEVFSRVRRSRTDPAA